MELLGFDLHFAAATMIKSKVLADFIAEWTEVPFQEEESPSTDDP
jgi:hypothetical protein